MNAVILDDDPEVRRLLEIALNLNGYKVASYNNPLSCPIYTDELCPCSRIQACPDLIISDFDMPFVNGIQFLEKLKQKKCKCRSIAIISGSWMEQDLKKIVPAGVTVFSKPLHFQRFSEWLSEIKGKSARPAHYIDQRSFPRYPCELEVGIGYISSGVIEVAHAVARNISKGGMLIEYSKTLDSMASYHLSFTVPEWMIFKSDADRAVAVASQVRHSSRTSGAYGLQFLEPLPI